MSGEVEMLPWGRQIDYTSPTGVKTKLYNIGTLAYAVGRDTQTIRKWEIAGILPPTPFRVGGKRMYSKEHIDAVVDSATRSKIKNGSSIAQTQFSQRLYRNFEKINKMFFGETYSDKEENNNEE